MIVNSTYYSNTYNDKITENISVCLVALLCLADLCFQSTVYIIIYAVLVMISLTFNIWQDIKLSNLRSFKVSYFEVWYIGFNLLLLVYGFLTTYNADGTQYSLFNHMLTVASAVSVARHFQLAGCNIRHYLRKVTLIGIPLICCFVIFMEWSMFIDKIPLIISGVSWYRLGDKNHWNSNSVAIHVSILSIFLNYVMIYEKDKKLKCYEILVFMLAGTTILLTGSKKGIVLLFLPLLLFPLAVPNQEKKAKNMILSTAVVIGGLYFVFHNEFLYHLLGQRIISMLGTMGFHMKQAYVYSASTADRSDMIKVGLSYFAQKPLFGNGWGYFYTNAGFGRYSHNNYVEILCSMGLFGFLIYYGYPVYIVIKAILNLRISENLICIFMLMFIFFIDAAAINCYDGMIVALMLCVATIINKNSFEGN